MADAACAMVAAGAGISIVPSLASAGAQGGGVVFRRLSRPIVMTSWLITPRGEAMSLLSEALLGEIRTRIRRLLERPGASDAQAPSRR